MVAIVFAFVIGISVARGASLLGYSKSVWFFAMLFGGPFTLGLVSALPDRRLERARKTELASLLREVETAKREAVGTTPTPEGTIGNMQTFRG